MRKGMVPFGHVEIDVAQRGRTNVNSKTVSVFSTGNPVVFFDDVLRLDVLGVDQVIGRFRRRADKGIRYKGCHRAQARSAVLALCINSSGSVNEITGTKQTSLLTHVVKTGMNIRARETAIQNGNDHAFATISHVVQHLGVQLGELCAAFPIVVMYGLRVEV